MSLKSATRAYLQDAVTAFNRAPAEIGLFIFTAAMLSYALETPVLMPAWAQLAVGAFVVFAFAWTGTLLHALDAITLKQRWVLTIVGLVCAVLYLTLVPGFEFEAEGWRAWMIIAATVLLMIAAPAWVKPSDPSLRMRRVNARILLRTIGVGLYGLALFAGLSLALVAIEKLFELNLDGEIYGHVFGWIMLVLVPWVIVGGLDDFIRPLDEVSSIERVGYRMTAFLVPPLIMLYYLILFLYAVRIVITSELPKNLVSPMVIAAGLLTALAAIVFDPQPAERNTGPRVLRAAPLLFVPLVPLGLWALFVRIDDYGWTEFRLLRVMVLVLLLVLAVLATVQLVRRRAFSIRVIPLVLGLAFGLAAVGPWSVLSIARRDQQSRLLAALEAAQIDPAQPAAASGDGRVVARELYDRINNIGFYLQQHFGPDALPVAGVPGSERYYSLADHLGLRAAASDTLPSVVFGSLPPDQPVRLEGGPTVYRVTIERPRAHPRDSALTISLGAGLRANLDTLLAEAQPGGPRRPGQRLPVRALPAFDANGAQRGDLVILEAGIRQDRDSIRIDRLDAVLIVR